LESDELCFIRVDAKAVAEQPVSDDKEAVCAFLANRLVGHACGNNGAIIDIGGKGFELPGFRDAKEGKYVNCGEDGGEGRTLQGTVVQDHFGEWVAVECEGDPPISEERSDPCAEVRGKTEEGKNVNKASDVKIVEEALDIKQEEAGDPTALDARLNSMSHAQDGIGRGVVVARPKLMGGKEVIPCRVQKNAFGHNPFQELTTAL